MAMIACSKRIAYVMLIVGSASKCLRASTSAYLALRIDLAHRPQYCARLNGTADLSRYSCINSAKISTLAETAKTALHAAMFAQILQHIKCRLEKVHVRSTTVARPD